MHVYVHSWSPNNGDRNQQKQLTFGTVFYNMVIYWIGLVRSSDWTYTSYMNTKNYSKVDYC